MTGPTTARLLSRLKNGGRPRALLVMGRGLASLIEIALAHGTYETRRVDDGDALRRGLDGWDPHLVAIDLDNSGALLGAVGRGIAKGQTPLLAFTRRRDAAVKLNAYQAGVDDIIEVPFTLDEIVARSYALVRRGHGLDIPIVPRIKLDGMEVDLLAQRVNVDGKSLSLTPLQQTLLYLLAANANDVLSREEILATIWGAEFEIESNVVDRHIRELRERLDDDWRRPRYIETVPGQGYRFLSQTGRPQQPN